MAAGMLIWHAGELMPVEALRVGADDRVFEHGLGLFETLRTWGGQPVLLDRHLERLKRSAEELGLSTAGCVMPDRAAVGWLVEASGFGIDEDARLRIVLTGGREGPSGAGLLWMRCDRLPAGFGPDGLTIGYGVYRVEESDLLARHKTLNYWGRRLAYEAARAAGSDERLAFTPDGRVWEGTRMNLFLVRGGAIWTPPISGPIVPGIMRELVLSCARELGIEAIEAELNLATIERAEEMFMTNAVRGVAPVGRLFDRRLEAPGPVTRRLRAFVRDRLEREA